MSALDDGGPAFPQTRQQWQDSQTGGRFVVTDATGGMSLRDWFAGQAPPMPDQWMRDKCPEPPPGGLFQMDLDALDQWVQGVADWEISRLVSWRWTYADAMLAARKGGAACIQSGGKT